MQQAKRIIIVVIIGLLLIATLFTIINWSDLKEKGVGGFFYDLFHPDAVLGLKSTVFSAEDRDVYGYGVYKETIIYAGKQGVSGMNLNAEWLWDETSVSFLKPYIKNCGEYTIIAELEGHWIFLFQKNVLVWKTELQGTIMSADVNAMGMVAVAHTLENYNGAITVFSAVATENGAGTVLFVNKLSTESVVAVALSPDSEQMTISSISTEQEKITGTFRFVNMKDGKTYASLQCEEEVYPLCHYVDNETVIAMNANGVRKLIRKKSAGTELDGNTELWGGNGSAESIYAACILDDKYIVVAGGNQNQGIYGQNTESKITVLDLNGKELQSFTVPGLVTRLDGNQGILAVGFSNGVSFYQADGVKLYDYETIFEVQKAIIINKKNFLVVTPKEAYILSAVPMSELTE